MSANDLGLRGRPPPAPFGRALTLVAMGGGATEGRALDDAKTWPAKLEAQLAARFDGVWVANAGRAGHSTAEHLRRLEALPPDLAPDYLLFLVGADDIGRGSEAAPAAAPEPRPPSLGARALEASALLRALLGPWRATPAAAGDDDDGALGGALELASTPEGVIDGGRIRAAMAEHLLRYAPGFEARLQQLIVAARARHTEPILVTQPALWGDAADPSSGLNLGPRVDREEVAALRWQVLEVYNGSTRRVAEQQGVLLLDLARRIPKDSRYFYDWLHLTNDGAALVAETLAAELAPWLARRGHGERS